MATHNPNHVIVRESGFSETALNTYQSITEAERAEFDRSVQQKHRWEPEKPMQDIIEDVAWDYGSSEEQSAIGRVGGAALPNHKKQASDRAQDMNTRDTMKEPAKNVDVADPEAGASNANKDSGKETKGLKRQRDALEDPTEGDTVAGGTPGPSTQAKNTSAEDRDNDSTAGLVRDNGELRSARLAAKGVAKEAANEQNPTPFTGRETKRTRGSRGGRTNSGPTRPGNASTPASARQPARSTRGRGRGTGRGRVKIEGLNRISGQVRSVDGEVGGSQDAANDLQSKAGSVHDNMRDWQECEVKENTFNVFNMIITPDVNGALERLKLEKKKEETSDDAQELGRTLGEGEDLDDEEAEVVDLDD